jgi:hypothetical protein
MKLTRRGILAASTIAFAGCGILPEESEPVEASASTPATLPDSTGYSEIQSEEQTIETTVNVDLTGDVELTSSRDVIATVFRRVYEADDGSRFGLVTAGSVTLLGEDATLTNATTTTGDGDVSMTWTRVRAGEDSVTAVASGGGDAPFDAVTRDG